MSGHMNPQIQNKFTSFIHDNPYTKNVPIPTQVDFTAGGSSASSDSYDWEAFDYTPGITYEAAMLCLNKIGAFQSLLSPENIGSLSATQYAQIATVLPTLLAVPEDEANQDEYIGRLGQIAEILGNEEVIQCIDALKSYNHDAQLAASQQAATPNGNSANGANGTNIDPPDGSGTPPINGNGNGTTNGNGDEDEKSLLQKIISPWYSKLALAGIVGGLGYYGYIKFMKKDKEEEKEEDELDLDNISLLEGETWVPKDFGQQLKSRQNPKKKRRKVRIKKKK